MQATASGQQVMDSRCDNESYLIGVRTIGTLRLVDNPNQEAINSRRIQRHQSRQTNRAHLQLLTDVDQESLWTSHYTLDVFRVDWSMMCLNKRRVPFSRENASTTPT